MKKNLFLLLAIITSAIASAQFAGVMRNQHEEPLPVGFKQASTNNFIAPYPAVNPQTRQATFRVVAPYMQNVALQYRVNAIARFDRYF